MSLESVLNAQKSSLESGGSQLCTFTSVLYFNANLLKCILLEYCHLMVLYAFIALNFRGKSPLHSFKLCRSD